MYATRTGDSDTTFRLSEAFDQLPHKPADLRDRFDR